MRRPVESHVFEFRLLGELQLVSDGREITLPASKKTRALLAYLVATGQAHRREWLCDLLWEGPDDPRGELRWSLAKIRPLLDSGGPICLKTDRSRVAFEPHDAVVDLATVRHLLADIPSAPLETLKAAIALFRGEFLDGLDLPACYRFQAWCLAERGAISALRLAALGALVARLSNRPEEALFHARALVVADPLSEEGHASVIRLLDRLGRRRAALSHYEQTRSVLERELGTPPSGALEQARRAIRPKSCGSVGRPEPAVVAEQAAHDRRTSTAIPFIGRRAERARIDRLVSAATDGPGTPLLLITGEPGIGKSRLLAYLAERMAMIGGVCLKARAFEAEAACPYGAWIDALRAVPVDTVPEDARQILVLLRPEWGPPPAAPTDRTRLFDAVLCLLRHLSRQTPLAVVLDDIQWLDEASSVLFHYVARSLDALNAVLFACAARSGELADNPAVSRTLRGFARDERTLEVPLAALNAVETAELVRAVDPAIDASLVHEESDGNPLFALELSRTYSEDHHRPGRPLQAVIAQQFATLSEPCRGLVDRASALGRTFGSGLLARLTDLDTPALLAALEELERRGFIRTVDADNYDFVHDLVRQAAYQELSQPRRKLMHRQIACVLDTMVENEPEVASDLARHAELAGDHALAARACVIAGERSLGLFANAEAATLARRGRAHLDRLPDNPGRRELAIGLLKIEVLAAAGPALHALPDVTDELSRAVAEAEEDGLHEAAATGHYLLSVLHQESGDIARARDSTLRAARIGHADQSTRARQLANTARCLIELETEIPRARTLLGEAEVLLGAAGQTVCELQWGHGLLQRWYGHQDKAVVLIERALAIARDAADRWREYKCLTWLAVVEYERGRYADTRNRCGKLRSVGKRLGEDEAPFADTMEALASLAGGSEHRFVRLDAALSRLRAVDDKSYLAYALNTAAVLCIHRQQFAAAEAYAREALDAANTMQRYNEIAVAEATLAQIGIRNHAQLSAFKRLAEQAIDRDRFHARARAAIDHAAARLPTAPAFPAEEIITCHASSSNEASKHL